MRSKTILAAAAAVMALGLAMTAADSTPAEAFERFKYRVGSPADPYSYQPRLPGYYPYYNSGYWRPIEEMRYSTRYRFLKPPYYQAWGYNTRAWYIANKDDRRHWRD